MNQLQPFGESKYPRFMTLLDRYAGYLASEGKSVRRSSPQEARRLFLALAEAQQAEVVARLESDVAIIEESVAAGERLVYASKLLWRLFARTRQTPCADLFGKIDDTDVVEVYGLDHRQKFQNFNFYDYVNHSLECIFCLPWYQLTRRDPAIEAQCLAAATRIFTGEASATFDPKIPPHLIEEVGTDIDTKIHYRLKWLSPVFRDHRLSGLVAVSACQLIE